MSRIKIGPITLHFGSKDGGPESRVFMYGVECKAVGSAVALRFENGSRETFHSHAFNALSWVLSGRLEEYSLHHGPALQYVDTTVLTPGVRPVKTARDRCHMVVSTGRSWALSFRGPWAETWFEVDDVQAGGIRVGRTLESGRKVVS